METADSLILAIENIRGTGVRVTNSQPVFGGDINSAYKLTLSDGSVIFMKANSRQKLAIFEGEAESLNFIKQTACYGADETVNLVGIAEVGDETLYCCPTICRYGDKWYLVSVSSFASMLVGLSMDNQAFICGTGSLFDMIQ